MIDGERPISDLLGKYLTPKKGAPTSEWAAAIEEVLMFLKEDKARFPYWCGRLRHMEPNDILDLIKAAKQGKNPPALFQWLLKEQKSNR